MSGQFQFEFHDYEEAFKQFYSRKERFPDTCLVVSRAPYASGYWVERNAKSNKFSEAYRSVKAVRNLEAIVRETIRNSNVISVGVIGV